MTDNDRSLLSVSRLKEVIAYDAETGAFIWAKSNSNRAIKGNPAGAVNSHGYLQIKIDRVLHKGHRLAWLYVHGVWPIGQIDHINGNRQDNRICNLRDVSPLWNSQHRVSLPKSNRCGFMGVIKRPNGRFFAEIRVNGKKIHLGSFDDPQEASRAYWAAKKNLHLGVISQEK